MVQLDRIGRRFGARELFRDLSWRITPGARLGLVGPNGAGKTTLLRLVSGREEPDSGAVHRPQGLQIGYLPQEVETVEDGSVLAVVLAGFEEVALLERRLEKLEERLALAGEDPPLWTRLSDEYGRLRERFEQLDGHRLEARAKAILSGLGVPEASFHRALESLSGGWRMRVVLARLLLGSPALLLLDEPTNHLDLEAIGWLEGFLASYEGAFVVVSHDRYFLNRMVREIVELERSVLTPYVGGYDDYLETKQLREQVREKEARRQEREIARTERFIERFRYKNTKARQVQSRIRALEKIERIEAPSRRKTIRFGFPAAPRSGDVVVRAEGVAKRFGERVVYDGLDLALRRGERVALVGPNGAGKSTLLKLLAGRTAPDAGRLETGHNVHVSYYAQHQLESLDPQASVLEELGRAAPGVEPLILRRLLGGFLFHGEDVDKRVEVLSGGEKARLALARLLIRPSNLLLLDEPTNHLDLQSREVLEEALDEYEGALVIVSHDRYFINRVATSVGVVGGARIELREGSYDEYLEWKERQEPQSDAGASFEAPAPDSRRSARDVKREEAEERNRRYRQRLAIEQRLAPLEREIEDLERERKELEHQQTDPAVYSDPVRAAETGRARSRVEERLDQRYAEWERVAASLSAETADEQGDSALW